MQWSFSYTVVYLMSSFCVGLILAIHELAGSVEEDVVDHTAVVAWIGTRFVIWVSIGLLVNFGYSLGRGFDFPTASILTLAGPLLLVLTGYLIQGVRPIRNGVLFLLEVLRPKFVISMMF